MRARVHFDDDLSTLTGDVQHLGTMVIQAVQEGFQALCERDIDRAKRVIDHDRHINQAERDIEARALRLIATQQPVASDMRRLVVAIEIAGELERIADYAKGIARMALRDAPVTHPVLPGDMERMAHLAIAMLQKALDAFIARDSAAAEMLAADDNAVDALYDRVEATLTDQMIDSDTAPWVAGLLFTAHYLERVADRATNIGERVVYLVQARMVELNP
ncbi:phosphate signaling complex protein PhoU [Roseiflexus sp.]|uniref:phosphate signaling complex protein PhoU n=1 Tax=Roseiflexus sp. TaxID=2562120 RepID=UPI00398B3592